MHEDAIENILEFWFEDIDNSLWFRKDPDFARKLEQHFGDLLKLAKSDQLDQWRSTPRGRLALIDRFGRFPHRNSILGRPNTTEEAVYLRDGTAGF